MKKYSFLYLFICTVLVCSVQISFGQKDVESNWVKHVIGSRINQDHGHSINKGDFNGDGRTDVSIAWGQRDGGKPTDGI